MYVDQELEIQAKKEYMDIELAKEKNPDIWDFINYRLTLVLLTYF
jgi:hypothetical protein